MLRKRELLLASLVFLVRHLVEFELVTVRVWLWFIEDLAIGISLQRVLAVGHLKLRYWGLHDTCHTDSCTVQHVQHLQVRDAGCCKWTAELVVLLEGVQLLLLRRSATEDCHLDQSPLLAISVDPYLDGWGLLVRVLVGECTDTELGLLLLREEDDLLLCEWGPETLTNTNTVDVRHLGERLSVNCSTERLRSEWDRWSSHVVHPISKDSS